LNLFLEKNPKIPKDSMFVDGYSFDAYNKAGLGKIAENAELAVKGTAKMRPPGLNLFRWIEYLKNVMFLAPVEPGKSLAFPEGVLRLGATFGIDGDKVVYVYEDGVPGDHPNPVDVIKAIESVVEVSA
jgi:hypothetical protein